jgi:hypothetical protein
MMEPQQQPQALQPAATEHLATTSTAANAGERGEKGIGVLHASSWHTPLVVILEKGGATGVRTEGVDPH